jgi:hypothetical protein
VIAMFRNPYDWVELMRKVPYHSPMHVNMEWDEFVETPWTMPRSDRDLVMNNNNNRTTVLQHRVCDQAFYYNEVVPCVATQQHQHAKYELRHDMSGEPYESILHLRRDKILNYLSIEQYQGVEYFDAWKYEDLAHEGSAQLLVRQLEQALGIKATCKPLEASQGKFLRRPKLDLDYVEWMQDHVDWDDTEALIGYHRSDY